MERQNRKANTAASYRIGAVANITGLSTHSIRAWERRYNLKLGERSSGGTRLYNDKDVVFLSLLKELTQLGDAISDVAHLPESELRQRLEMHHKVNGSVDTSKLLATLMNGDTLSKAIVLGHDLADCLGCGSSVTSGWRTCWKFDSVDELWQGLHKTHPDVLLTHLRVLGPDALSFLDKWNKQSASVLVIVFYEFNPSAILTAMVERGAKLIKWPVDGATLAQLIPDYCLLHRLQTFQQNRAKPLAPEPETTVPRMFTDAQLMELRAVSTNVECECPKHLASLVFELNAFEDYSRNCNGEGESAEFHAKLALETARARAALEKMLIQVCHRENLKI